MQVMSSAHLVVRFPHAPVIIMTNAVRLHRIRVSIKVPNIATMPCLTGVISLGSSDEQLVHYLDLTRLRRWPLAKPQRIAIQMDAPRKPPLAAEPVNALSIMSKNAAGNFSIFKRMIANAQQRYKIAAMKGTSFEATCAIRFTPPIITMEAEYSQHSASNPGRGH